MKGRNCYAQFCKEPGLEKLIKFLELKLSFLRPVTPKFSRRVPFSVRAVAGPFQNLLCRFLLSQPATAVFFAFLFMHRSWVGVSQVSQFLFQVSSCGVFLCMAQRVRRPVNIPGFKSQCSTPCRPSSFSVPRISFSWGAPEQRSHVMRQSQTPEPLCRRAHLF